MIYFIQDSETGTIKIGMSENPLRRLADLQTAHHAKLELVGIMDGQRMTEQELHGKFSRKQGEWFEPTADLLQYIADKAMSIPPLVEPLNPDFVPPPPAPPTPLERLAVTIDRAMCIGMAALFFAALATLIYLAYSFCIYFVPYVHALMGLSPGWFLVAILFDMLGATIALAETSKWFRRRFAKRRPTSAKFAPH